MGFKIENGVLVDYIEEEGVTDIVIPEGVRVIDEDVFRGSDITSVVIPEGVEEILDSAFYECFSLRKISIPASVKLIEVFSLDQCTRLETIEVSSENEHYCVVDGILYDKEMTELIKCPAEIKRDTLEIPHGVKYIDGYAFNTCDVKKIILPDTVEKIYSSAFCYSSIEEMILPDSVVELTGYTFEECEHLKKVVFSKNLKKIPSNVFCGVNLENKNGLEVTIPDGVEEIEESAFSGCVIENLFIPASVKKMDFAFGENSSILKNITVDPANTEYSDIDGVLYNKAQTRLMKCPVRTSITLPSACTEIDEEALMDDYQKLKEIKVDENNSEFSSIDGILYDKVGKVLILCPDDYDSTIVIPDGVEKIAKGAFTNDLWNARRGLVITIPESVVEIGEIAIAPECDLILKYHGKEKRVTLDRFWGYAEGEENMLDTLRSDM